MPVTSRTKNTNPQYPGSLTDERIEEMAERLQQEVLDSLGVNPMLPDAAPYRHPKYAADHAGIIYQELPNLTEVMRASGAEIPKGHRYVGVAYPEDNLVIVEESLRIEEKRMTGMHELCHCLLHKRSEYRERPIGPNINRTQRPRDERQADRYAGSYIMPSEVYDHQIEARFGSFPLVINETTLDQLRPHYPKDRWPHTSELFFHAMAVAKCTSFDGHEFIPLDKEFIVTVSAAAKRIIERKAIKLHKPQNNRPHNTRSNFYLPDPQISIKPTGLSWDDYSKGK